MIEKSAKIVNEDNSQGAPSDDIVLLRCPIRGDLTTPALAKDGLTATEEARRIDFIEYLLDRGYPADYIAVETVVLKGLGESGRNSLRADVIVYDLPRDETASLETDARLERAVLVGEIKRDSAKKPRGITCQLEPAMRQLPGMRVLGAYWDDINRILFTKELVKRDGDTVLEIHQDALANLPDFGAPYREKAITVDTLTEAGDLVSVLQTIANVMRSHGVNDEHLRYKETVKLLLARYCDEKQARATGNGRLDLQVLPGSDSDFLSRVTAVYQTAARRYSRAQSLFTPIATSELDELTQREIIVAIQGMDLSSASNESLQQVFMSFVPAVFKKSLDQYFTPPTLIDCMVAMTQPGPNDKIADPAMGTGDFLTAGMEYRTRRGDDDVVQRVYGVDSDQKAYDLAVINMILNKDGQSNLVRADSLEKHALWNEEMDVVLCNPPFGARTLEKRAKVLRRYDLGHEWEVDEKGRWQKTRKLLPSQQLGILFIERSVRMLSAGGRLAIILPEGYLCSAGYGYVRQWIAANMQLLSLVELPRRIFVKSDADLRSNIVVGVRRSPKQLAKLIADNYPIYTGMVRRVGYKLGKGFGPLNERHPETGEQVRDGDNKPLLASDFRGVLTGFEAFGVGVLADPNQPWRGARIRDILSHANLDLKPRRLMPRALENINSIRTSPHVRLGDVAVVLRQTQDVLANPGPSGLRRLIEGQDIRAIEGTVVPQEPQRCWAIAERKAQNVYEVNDRDVVIGLVRPERRNIGMVLGIGSDAVATPDGVAIVRSRPEKATEYPQAWLLAALRSEACRLQFWTESGGTSYGKLTLDQIEDALLPDPGQEERHATADLVDKWAAGIEGALVALGSIGDEADRKPILNSPLFGLVDDAAVVGLNETG